MGTILKTIEKHCTKTPTTDWKVESRVETTVIKDKNSRVIMDTKRYLNTKGNCTASYIGNYTYDENGNEISYKLNSTDENNNPTIEEFRNSYYDAEGRLVLIHSEKMDGDIINYSIYHYEDNGDVLCTTFLNNKFHKEVKTAADGTLLSTTFKTEYNSGLLKYVYDSESDGMIAGRIYDYDSGADRGLVTINHLDNGLKETRVIITGTYSRDIYVIIEDANTIIKKTLNDYVMVDAVVINEDEKGNKTYFINSVARKGDNMHSCIKTYDSNGRLVSSLLYTTVKKEYEYIVESTIDEEGEE